MAAEEDRWPTGGCGRRRRAVGWPERPRPHQEADMTHPQDDQQAQLSHAAGSTDVPLLEETIPDNLDATVARFGDREALVDVARGRPLDLRGVRGPDGRRLARALLASGVVKGDRVGIWAPNCAEWTLAQYATAKIGAILVNINPSYRTHELEYVLKQAGISRSSSPRPSSRPSNYAR